MEHQSVVSVRPSTRGDERWERWVSKGRAHDERLRYRARTIALTIGSVITFWLAARITLQ